MNLNLSLVGATRPKTLKHVKLNPSFYNTSVFSSGCGCFIVIIHVLVAPKLFKFFL